MDFDAHKHAINFVFLKAVSPARGMGIVCDVQDDGTLTINESFMENLRIVLEPDELNISDGQSSAAAPAENGEPVPAEQPAEQPVEQPADDAAADEEAE